MNAQVSTNSTSPTGIYASAMGNSTTASGNESTAMGYDTTASGEASTAMGYSTTASAQSSTAMGRGTTQVDIHSNWSTQQVEVLLQQWGNTQQQAGDSFYSNGI